MHTILAMLTVALAVLDARYELTRRNLHLPRLCLPAL